MTTSKASEVTQAVLKVVNDNSRTMGIRVVYYGDQDVITEAPAVCVIPAVKRKMWANSGLMVESNFELSLLVYSTSITKTIGEIQAECDKLTEDLEDLLDIVSSPAQNGGTQLGGLITQGICTGIEYGYKRFNDKLVRMNRIIWSASSGRTPIASGV